MYMHWFDFETDTVQNMKHVSMHYIDFRCRFGNRKLGDIADKPNRFYVI